MRTEAAGLRPRLGRADRRRSGGGRDGGALEAPARPPARARAAARTRYGRARRDRARVRAGDRLRASDRSGSRSRSTSTSSPSSRARPTPGTRWPCAWRRSSTTSASPRPTADGGGHAARRRRARAPDPAPPAVPECASETRSCRLVAGHAFDLDGPVDGALRAPVPRLATGSSARASSSSTSAPTSPRSRSSRWELEHLGMLDAALEARARCPHRLADLAVDGDDLIAIGYAEGPELGAALARLLDVVVDEPGSERPRSSCSSWRARGAERPRRSASAIARIRDEAGRARHRRRGDEVRPGRRARRSSRRRASRSSARTARRTSRRSTRPTATRSAGTSSATCSRTRRRS